MADKVTTSASLASAGGQPQLELGDEQEGYDWTEEDEAQYQASKAQAAAHSAGRNWDNRRRRRRPANFGS